MFYTVLSYSMHSTVCERNHQSVFYTVLSYSTYSTGHERDRHSMFYTMLNYSTYSTVHVTPLNYFTEEDIAIEELNLSKATCVKVEL